MSLGLRVSFQRRRIGVSARTRTNSSNRPNGLVRSIGAAVDTADPSDDFDVRLINDTLFRRRAIKRRIHSIEARPELADKVQVTGRGDDRFTRPARYPCWHAAGHPRCRDLRIGPAVDQRPHPRQHGIHLLTAEPRDRHGELRRQASGQGGREKVAGRFRWAAAPVDVIRELPADASRMPENRQPQRPTVLIHTSCGP